MSQSFNKNRFDLIIKGVHYFLRWAIIGLFVLSGLILVGTVITVFVPKDALDFNLANIENINVQVMNVLYSINDSAFSGIINIKWLLIFGGFAAIINIGFVIYFMLQLKHVVGNVRQEEPFSDDSVKHLRYLGIAYLLSALLLPILNQSFMMYVVNLLNIWEAKVNFSLNLQALFMGLLILILAGVFEYGKYLQEDHDLTV